jgi:hypothetical protein
MRNVVEPDRGPPPMNTLRMITMAITTASATIIQVDMWTLPRKRTTAAQRSRFVKVAHPLGTEDTAGTPVGRDPTGVIGPRRTVLVDSTTTEQFVEA